MDPTSPTNDEDKLLWKIGTVATALQLSERGVRNLNHLGILPPPVKINGSVRWRANDIRAYVAALPACPAGQDQIDG